MHRSIWVFRTFVACGVIAALSGKAFPAVFTNSSPITFSPGSSVGSVISVPGIGNAITSVSVMVNGFSTSHAADVGLVLVSPSGAALVLQGDCGDTTVATNISLAYDDNASTQLFQNLNLTSGTFKPTQYASIGSFPSPGPGLAYQSPAPFGTSTFNSVFNGKDPGGNWSLYVIDSDSSDTGEVSRGWNLTVTAVPEPASLLFIAFASAGLTLRRRR